MRYLSYYTRRLLAGLPAMPGTLVMLRDFLWAVVRDRPRPWVACFAYGMRSLPCLESHVGCRVIILPTYLAEWAWHLLPGCIGVAVWGTKEELGGPPSPFGEHWPPFRDCVRFFSQKRLAFSRRFAIDFAKRHDLELIRMEDGFLRSVDLGVNGATPNSLVVDRVGIYYDARSPSALENLLASDWEIPDPAVARDCLDYLLEHDLSKYNHTRRACDLPGGRKRVLVLDQTYGDMSIRLGLADDACFSGMLEDAMAENPDCEILVKVHPDVVSGKKKGHFDVLPQGVRKIGEDVNPLSLLRKVDVVYTVTSQMGFEALLLGLPVHCYGMPFYAGWGLTQDRLVCPRRKRRRSLLELFWAAYGVYPRYVDPVNGERLSLRETMRHLVYERDLNSANAGYHCCLFFSRWKRAHARAFLQGTRSRVDFFPDLASALACATARNGDIVVWSSKAGPEVESACKRAGVPLLRMEDGFVRSIGLGSDFHAPGSLVLDDLGIYYDPSRESRLERLLGEERTDEELREAETVMAELVRAGISKYNVRGESDLPEIPRGRRVLLVPGQVEDDASVRLGGMGIGTNAGLLAAVRKANPDAYILYKEHPDVVSGNRIGALPAEARHLADAMVRTVPIEQVLPLCDEVHTLTSLTGFEAILRGIPVTTYGGPFYAGWGLTRDRLEFPRRVRRLTPAHLVYGALIAYPRYYSYARRMLVPCLSYVRALAKKRAKG